MRSFCRFLGPWLELSTPYVIDFRRLRRRSFDCIFKGIRYLLPVAVVVFPATTCGVPPVRNKLGGGSVLPVRC